MTKTSRSKGGAVITCDKCVESREGKGAVVYCYRRDGWVWADNRHGCKHGRGRESDRRD